MTRPSIRYVFDKGASHTTTREFYRQIRENPADYADLRVINLTRVKNLKSSYVHEYLQFIVEHKPTGERARVYSERRGFQTQLPYPDWISYGDGFDRNGPDPWGFLAEAGKAPEKPGTITDLPMPLATLTFADGGVSLVQLAELFDVITRVGGVYDLLGHSCFWFANTAYKMIQTEMKVTEQRYTRYDMGGKGGGGKTDAWAFLIPKYLGRIWAGEARKFEAMKAEGYERADEDEAEDIEKAVNAIIAPLTLEQYFEILQKEGVPLNHATLQREAAKEAKNLDQEGSDDEGPRNESLDEYVRQVLNAEPGAQGLA